MLPDDDGINILGALMGSSAFIEFYLKGNKSLKHRQLLDFIKEVLAAGYPR